VIDTHWHFDRADGNAAFARAGATVLAHANCRTRLSTNQYVPSLSWRISASPREAWPSLMFDHPFTLDIGTEELRLLPQAPARPHRRRCCRPYGIGKRPRDGRSLHPS
jgi:glyoxylase-like metal-dependent hydrolase (beta-lactamase superfamily II)